MKIAYLNIVVLDFWYHMPFHNVSLFWNNCRDIRYSARGCCHLWIYIITRFPEYISTSEASISVIICLVIICYRIRTNPEMYGLSQGGLLLFVNFSHNSQNVIVYLNIVMLEFCYHMPFNNLSLYCCSEIILGMYKLSWEGLLLFVSLSINFKSW